MALANIASGTFEHEHTKVFVEVGAVPIFVRLLRSPNNHVREQAVRALGNIAGYSPPCRDLVLQAGAMPPLLKQLDWDSSLFMARNVTWAISNFCSGIPHPDFALVRGSLPFLEHVIKIDDEAVLKYACCALFYLSSGSSEKIQAVIDAGVCGRLVGLLQNPAPMFMAPALRTVGNIATGSPQQVQFLVEVGCIQPLCNLLTVNDVVNNVEILTTVLAGLKCVSFHCAAFFISAGLPSLNSFPSIATTRLDPTGWRR